MTQRMLLRSASTPILNPCVRESSPDNRPVTRSVSMSISSSSSLPLPNSTKRSNPFRLEGKKGAQRHGWLAPPPVLEGGGVGLYLPKAAPPLTTMTASSVEVVGPSFVVGGGDGNGGTAGGGGGGGGGGGSDGYWDSEKGSESLDGYYQEMIKEYPEDALLLGNYARFLNEVQGDVERAEEYCERAILARTNDGNVLSLYGDLIWNRHKDSSRAQSYFNQAVQSSPDDSFVLASYAKFLWDAEEEEEKDDDGNNEEKGHEAEDTQTCTPPSLVAGS